MFVGTYEVRLDAKNRVIVPQKLRESRDEGGPVWPTLYLTLGAEGCVFCYSPEGWQRVMEALGAMTPLADGNLRKLQRIAGGNAAQCELDGQGRIVLPQMLRSHAALTRDVVWVGAVGRAEIWDKERWLAYNSANVGQLGEMFDAAARAGLILPGGATGP
jgi:transcriptional regulator MraZ